MTDKKELDIALKFDRRLGIENYVRQLKKFCELAPCNSKILDREFLSTLSGWDEHDLGSKALWLTLDFVGKMKYLACSRLDASNRKSFLSLWDRIDNPADGKYPSDLRYIKDGDVGYRRYESSSDEDSWES